MSAVSPEVPGKALDGGGRRTALGLLLGISFFNYADRYMLAILIPDIQREFQLSDTQIGFMTGIAFTLLYATLGVPIARLADLYSRRKLLSVVLAFWSAMTVLCGMAQSFMQLLVARVLVGVGEAGCTPAAHSMISDYFPPKKRASALSIYTLGEPIGMMTGFALGGMIAALYGWRVALICFGVPGIVYAAIVFWKLKDPPRRKEARAPDQLVGTSAPPFWAGFRTLVKKRTFVHCCLGMGIYGVVCIGQIFWLPSFLTRTFDLEPGRVGLMLALALGLAQLLGLLTGGLLADRLAKSDTRWYLWLPGVAVCIASPLYAAVFLAPTAGLALVALALPAFLGIMQAGPVFSVVQSVSGPGLRAVGAASFVLAVNLIGSALGPQIIGITSDLLSGTYGADSLRYAMLGISVIFSLWGGVHYFLGSRSIAHDANPA